MILTCNSCGKKFVVPDSAITSSGRMVQCGSCGNKWRQFPTGEIKTNQSITPSSKIIVQKVIDKKIKYNISNKIDPNIIGGFILKVDDLNYDASLKRKFTDLKSSIIESN